MGRKRAHAGDQTAERPAKRAVPPRTRDVEVVTFVEPGRLAPTSSLPGGKRKFLSPDVTKIYDKPARSIISSTDTGEKDEDEDAAKLDFSLRDLLRLGMSTLTGKEKRKQDLKEIVSLGGHAPKAPTVPLPMLHGMHRKAKIREAKQRDKEIAMGTYIKKAKPSEPESDKPRAAARGSRWVDRSSIDDRRLRGGVLVVKQ